MHDDYLKDRQDQGLSRGDRRSLAPWEELPEQVREWTRRQADHIGEKLAAAGYDIVPLADLDGIPVEFTPGEIEIMVRMERERFVSERRAEGWTDGPLDPAKKKSPHLGAWEDLPPDIQEYVRRTIRRMPGLLAEAGFQVTKRPASPPS